jgi:hypothetical protein
LNCDKEHIRSGTGINFGINYLISPNLALGVEFDNISSLSEGRHSLSNLYQSENHVNGFLGNLSLKTSPMAGFMALTAGFSAGPYFCNYSEAENDFVTEGKCTQFGMKVTAGTLLDITPLFGLKLNGGYRSLRPDHYGVTFFLPQKPDVTLDYSGFFGEIKVLIRL